MTRLGTLKALAVVLGGAMAAVACGGGSTGSTGGNTNKGEIVIASDLPTSGADASSGLPTQNGVAYAVSLHQNVKGFKLTFLPFDDTVNGVHDPQKGAQNVQQMISNPKVLGMVGPFNSNVARAEIPVGNGANLAMISPSNTNECLTQSFPYCNPQPQDLRKGNPNNYFRTAAADTFQGPAMADFAYDTLKVTKVAVFSDNETFGKNVADQFSKEFQKKGGSITNRQDFDWKSTNDFKPFLTAAKNAGAQAIYAGATSATKGCIPRAQSKGIIDVPYMGPDGIVDAECIKTAGDQANDKMYGTVAAADATQSSDPFSKQIVEGYKKAYPKKEDLAAYTFPGFDCALILIDAIGRAIDANGGKMPTRAQVVKAVGETKNLHASTGTFTFTPQGDPTNPVMAFFQLQGSPPDWAFVKQFAVGGSS